MTSHFSRSCQLEPCHIKATICIKYILSYICYTLTKNQKFLKCFKICNTSYYFSQNKKSGILERPFSYSENDMIEKL